jgi:hypothetical protein
VFSDTERGEIDREEKEKQLLLLKAEADAARLRLELALLQERKYSREREEIAATEELERLEDAAGLRAASLSPEPVTRTTDLDILDLELSANSGWLQGDLYFV